MEAEFQSQNVPSNMLTSRALAARKARHTLNQLTHAAYYNGRGGAKVEQFRYNFISFKRLSHGFCPAS
jgi:hypothetical protein